MRQPAHAGLGGRPAASRSARAVLAGPGVWIVVLLAAVLLAWQFLGASTIPLAAGLIGAGIELRWLRSAHDNPPWRGFVGGIVGASIGAAAVYLVGSLAAVGQTLLRVLLLGIVAALALRVARWLGTLRRRR
ncbi:MAG: hypothetical protein KJZ87_11565 [Thermoguttaceae bacterium]|nr:hypothetical protein [Thermoguttaceae bacterium]